MNHASGAQRSAARICLEREGCLRGQQEVTGNDVEVWVSQRSPNRSPQIYDDSSSRPFLLPFLLLFLTLTLARMFAPAFTFSLFSFFLFLSQPSAFSVFPFRCLPSLSIYLSYPSLPTSISALPIDPSSIQ